MAILTCQIELICLYSKNFCEKMFSLFERKFFTCLQRKKLTEINGMAHFYSFFYTSYELKTKSKVMKRFGGRYEIWDENN